MSKSKQEHTITVSEITVTSLKPNVHAKYAMYLPSFHPDHAEVTISGLYCSYAGAIRATISNCLIVSGMECEYEDIETNRDAITQEIIQQRLRMIPVMQNTPKEMTFNLYFANNAMEMVKVYSENIKPIKGNKEYFNGNIEICTLDPGEYINIENIKIVQSNALPTTYGTFVLAVHAVSKAMDVIPYNAYTGEGESSQTNRSKVSCITFDTNGTETPINILKQACEQLVERLQIVIDSLLQPGVIISANDKHIITINQEIGCFGTMVHRAIYEYMPDIPFVCANYESTELRVILTMVCNQSPADIIKPALQEAQRKYATILKQLR